MGSDGRSYVTGYYGLVLDGIDCGLAQKVEGGDVEGEGRVLTLQMGLSMGQPVKDWIDASLAMSYMRKSGEIKAADADRSVHRVSEFENALLTEIGFPACGGSATGVAFMTLKFSPWIVRNKKGDGSKVDNPADMSQKQWHPSDFRLTIDGLHGATEKVSKVDAIVIKQSVVSDQVGSERDYFKEPGKVDYPNIRITLPEADSADFSAWHDDSAGSHSGKKNGRLAYLDPERNELLVLELKGLGIHKISKASTTNNEDKIASVTVEMYVENITSKFA
jgi:hypothetical protein